MGPTFFKCFLFYKVYVVLEVAYRVRSLFVKLDLLQCTLQAAYKDIRAQHTSTIQLAWSVAVHSCDFNEAPHLVSGSELVGMMS